MSGRFMMATKAIHKLGDISRDPADLCVVYREEGENFIGNWIEGFGFVNVEFPKETTRELTEEEKERFHGMRVAIGDRVAFEVDTKEPTDEFPRESPVIILPDNEELKRRLEKKLEEYRERRDPYRAPELDMDTVCKIEVLEKLLKDGRVDTWSLHKELVEKYGDVPRIPFNRACGVIEDYCKTGGKKVSGGTGLPKVASA